MHESPGETGATGAAAASSRRKPGRIFINYRRDDTGGVAGRLADTLNRYFGRGRVFRDVDGIETGADFEQVLHRTAQQADAMIVLIGARWTSTADAQGHARLHDPQDWVAREIAAALERRIPIFPVLVESAVMPRADELPEMLKGLIRYNAMSVSDQRWESDVQRLARVVAIDIPGSVAERTLQWVQWVVSVALWFAVLMPTVWLAWNHFHEAPVLLPLGASGVAPVVIVGAAMVLLYFARLIDPARRRPIYAAVGVGLLGTLAYWIWLGVLGVDHPKAPVGMYTAATTVAVAMLALMGWSGFKAR